MEMRPFLEFVGWVGISGQRNKAEGCKRREVHADNQEGALSLGQGRPHSSGSRGSVLETRCCKRQVWVTHAAATVELINIS